MTGSGKTPIDELWSPDGTYLLSHSVGLPPLRTVRRSVDGYLRAWDDHGGGAWPTWLETIETFRATLAGLLAATPTSICPQPNVSAGVTKILQAIRPDGRRPSILLSELAFPSLGYVCRHADYDVRWIPADQPATDPATWAEHLVDDVDVVLVTHVHSNTGELIPAGAITELATARKITSIVDVAQSVGVVPIDVGAWGADFVVGSCVKWLCGGPGAGWMWVRPDVIDRCEPVDVGWFSHEDPFEFDIHDFRYARDALRFWGGTPTVLPFAVAQASIEVIDTIGVDAVRAHNLHLGRQLIDALGDRIVSPTDDQTRSGTVIVAGDPSLVTSLGDAGIAVDHRARGIRVSPHVYNDEADITALVDHLSSSV